ncbi:hypothetical protein Q8A73_020874 [Channa argus]|nr:hypothetical protein Q8A73_020874 [Channa argus]
MQASVYLEGEGSSAVCEAFRNTTGNSLPFTQPVHLSPLSLLSSSSSLWQNFIFPVSHLFFHCSLHLTNSVSKVKTDVNEAEHSHPIKRFTHTLTQLHHKLRHGPAEKKGIKLERQKTGQEEPTVAEESEWRRKKRLKGYKEDKRK